MLKVEWLYSISGTQHNSGSCCMIHNLPLGEVVQIIPGVETTVAMNEIQTEFLRKSIYVVSPSWEVEE